MEAAGHLPLLLRDGRGVLPLRRADLRHEVRQLDLRRLPGSKFIFDLGAIISKHLESLDPFLSPTALDGEVMGTFPHFLPPHYSTLHNSCGN